MERIVNIAKTVRSNWKKSTLGAVAVYYGVSKIKEKYDINILMTAACKEAVKYGDTLIPIDRNPTLVTVILNPVANKRKAKQDYEKYCEPLLHLAGLQVDVIQTTSEGNAKEVVETLRGTEAIIVAGGDGTLSEAVTGLLRRQDNANQFPLGVLPVGRTNTLGNTLFPGGEGVYKVKQLIEATMAIVKGHTTWKDAMKIEQIETAEEETPNKPIYAMTSVVWGAFRDTLAKRDSYWIYGPLRDYVSFIFNGYKHSLTWDCKGVIKYTPPCLGCNNCIEKRPQPTKKWLFFMPYAHAASEDESAISNIECSSVRELCFKTCDFRIHTPNIEGLDPVPSLKVILGKNAYTYTEFVAEGWRRIKGQKLHGNVIPARTLELIPNETEKEVTIEIDKEEFEVKPIRITLLPKVVKLFCSSESKQK